VDETRLGGGTLLRGCRMIERNHDQHPSALVGCGQRIVWVITPCNPRYFTHVGHAVGVQHRGMPDPATLSRRGPEICQRMLMLR
jgi:hypothetical protein